MRPRTLLTQVLAVNTVLVALTAFVAALVARDQLKDAISTEGLLLIALAVFGVVLLNSILLRRRLEPMGRLVETMSSVDLATPGKRADVSDNAAEEVRRLSADFNRMLERLEHERRESGRAVLRAQEVERSRIAQDLHDEVNQALTAILLRLSATIQTAPPGLQEELRESQALVTQAMEELLHLARQLRPTALDDHGLVPALASQVADFGDRTGIRSNFRRHGTVPKLSRRGAARHLPRHAGEPLQRRPARGRAARRRRAVVRRPHRPARARRRRGLPDQRQRPQHAAGRLRHARARAAGGRPALDLLRAR